MAYRKRCSKEKAESSKQIMELVSIIITYYNYEKYIADCLMSCVAQTYDNTEVLLINDNSPDEGYKIANELAWRYKINLRVIAHPENRGYAEAKNTGIKNARGEFITFIDADDMLTPESIQVRVDAFDKNIEFVDGHVYDVTDVDMTYRQCMESRDKLKKALGTQRYFKKEHAKKIHAQGMMFRRTVFEKYGLYWNIVSKADKEMNYRLGIHPDSPLPKLIKRRHIEDFVAFYRRHDNSMKSALDFKRKIKLKHKFALRIAQLLKEGITSDNTPSY